jgi:hypothetical protein
MFIFFGVEFSFSGWSHFKGMSLEITFLNGHFFKLVIRVFRQKKRFAGQKSIFRKVIWGHLFSSLFMRGKSTPKKGVQLRFAGSYLKNESAFQVEKIVIANLKSIYMNVCFC